MSKLKVGCVGTGGIWNLAHGKPWMEHPETQIAAVCDIVKAKAEKAAAVCGAKHVFTDYRELLAMDEIDIIDICTPNVLHSEISVAALNAGKHVLCEKPDAVSVEEARKMADAARKSGRTLMVIRNNRFRSDTQFLKRYVDAGHMGEVYTGRCGWIRRRGIPGKGGWFTTKAMSGGGPLIDLGVHVIDLAMWLMGNPRPVSVVGATYCKFAKVSGPADSIHAQFGEAKDGGVFDVEDLASGFIRFENGATLQIEFSWASNIDHEMTFVELRGAKAGFNLGGGPELRIATEIEGTLCDIVPRPAKIAHEHQGGNIGHFVDVLRGRAKPTLTPEQGLDMIKVLCAIYESAETKEEVVL